MFLYLRLCNICQLVTFVNLLNCLKYLTQLYITVVNLLNSLKQINQIFQAFLYTDLFQLWKRLIFGNKSTLKTWSKVKVELAMQDCEHQDSANPRHACNQ